MYMMGATKAERERMDKKALWEEILSKIFPN